MALQSPLCLTPFSQSLTSPECPRAFLIPYRLSLFLPIKPPPPPPRLPLENPLHLLTIHSLALISHDSNHKLIMPTQNEPDDKKESSEEYELSHADISIEKTGDHITITITGTVEE